MIPARFPNGMELRAALEFRVAPGRKLAGYAAVFGKPARVGSFTESVRSGAFAASLRDPKSDVLMLMDHQPDKLLARQSNGSLRLAEDSRGLEFEMTLPGTTLGNDALAMVEARLAGGCSFGFRVLDEVWPNSATRELRAVELVEISLVSAFPAYAETSVHARSRHSAEVVDELRRRRAWVRSL